MTKINNPMINNRYICTKYTPYVESKDDRKWQHPDAVEIDQLDGYPCGDIVIYQCPHCNVLFKIELPQ